MCSLFKSLAHYTNIPIIVDELNLGSGVGLKPLWAKRLNRSVVSKLRTVF